MSDTKNIDNPQNQVVATLDTDSLDEVIDALTSAGFSSGSFTTIKPDDIGNIDSPLTEPGVTGFVHRIFLGYGADLKNLEHLHHEVVDNKRSILMIPVEEDEQKDQAVDILRDQGAHTVEYVGNWTIEVH